jgi:hypothetical protein
LEQQPGRTFPFAAAPSGPGARPRERAQALRFEEPVERRAPDRQLFVALPQFLERADIPVVLLAAFPDQLMQPSDELGIRPVGGRASPVPGDNARQAVRVVTDFQAVDLALADPQQFSRLPNAQSPSRAAGEELGPPLLRRIQDECPHTPE